MIPDLSLANLMGYWLQSTLVAAAGAAALHWLRIESPRVRLGVLQGLLAAALLGPFLGVQPGEPAPANQGAVITVTPNPNSPPAAPPDTKPFPWANAVLMLLGAGAVLRVGWLALGLLRMERLRRQAEPLAPLPDAIRQMQRDLGVDVPFYVSNAVSSPLTFGFLRPAVVLAMVSLRDADGATLRSIACHELLHVRRRDWLTTVAEEVLLSAFWFLPGVYWITSHTRLAREQIVDQEVVSITRQRDGYIALLLALAGVETQPRLAPAIPFTRPRHLVRRVDALTSEVSMSRSRLVVAVFSFLAAVAGVLWASAVVWPLETFAQEPPAFARSPNGELIWIEQGEEGLLYRGSVRYPEAALAERSGGRVELSVSVAADGNVQDASVVSGPAELRSAALRMVLAWQYVKSPRFPATVAVALRFQPPDTPVPTRSGRLSHVTASLADGGVLGVIQEIDFNGVTEAAQEQLRNQLPVREGDMLTAEGLRSARVAVAEISDRLRLATQRKPQTQTVSLTVIYADPFDVTPVITRMVRPARPRVTFAPPDDQDGQMPKRITVNSKGMREKRAWMVPPEYPALARQSRIQGTVQMTALIDGEGSVRELQVESGHPLLIPAALESVKQWRYKPTLLNGQPVEVETTIDVHFTLSDN